MEAQKYKNIIIHLLIFHSFIKIFLHCIFIHVYGRNMRDMWGPPNHHLPLKFHHLHHIFHHHIFHFHSPPVKSTKEAPKDIRDHLTTKQGTLRKMERSFGQSVGPASSTYRMAGLPLSPLYMLLLLAAQLTNTHYISSL
jgi:hypothetical protein